MNQLAAHRHRWVLDLHASSHHAIDLRLLRDGGDLTTNDLQEIADVLPEYGDIGLPILGRGSVQTDRFRVSRVRYIQGEEANTISAPLLVTDPSLEVGFEQQRFHVKDRRTKEIVGRARLQDGVYVLDYLLIAPHRQGSNAISFPTGPTPTSEDEHGEEEATAGAGAKWVLDCLAATHRTSNLRLLYDLHMLLPERMNEDGIAIPHTVWRGLARSTGVDVPNVRYSRGETRNCVSAVQLALDHGLSIVFQQQHCYINDPETNNVVGEARLRNRMYVLDYLFIGAQQGIPAGIPQEEEEEDGQQDPASEWILSTFARQHQTSDLGLLYDLEIREQDLQQVAADDPLWWVDDEDLYIDWHGLVKNGLIRVPNVRYVGGSAKNIISVSQLAFDHGLVAVFEPSWCYVKDQRGRDVGRARLRDGAYVLDYLLIDQEDSVYEGLPPAVEQEPQQPSDMLQATATNRVVVYLIHNQPASYQRDVFFLDSGTTHHVTPDATVLSSRSSISGNMPPQNAVNEVYIGGTLRAGVTDSGNIVMGDIRVDDVLQVVLVDANVISQGQLAQQLVRQLKDRLLYDEEARRHGQPLVPVYEEDVQQLWIDGVARRLQDMGVLRLLIDELARQIQALRTPMNEIEELARHLDTMDVPDLRIQLLTDHLSHMRVAQLLISELARQLRRRGTPYRTHIEEIVKDQIKFSTGQLGTGNFDITIGNIRVGHGTMGDDRLYRLHRLQPCPPVTLRVESNKWVLTEMTL